MRVDRRVYVNDNLPLVKCGGSELELVVEFEISIRFLVLSSCFCVALGLFFVLFLHLLLILEIWVKNWDVVVLELDDPHDLVQARLREQIPKLLGDFSRLWVQV